MTTAALVLLAAVAWPITLLAMLAFPTLRRMAVLLAPTLALPALMLAFLGDATLELRAPGVFTSMKLGADAVGQPFLLLTALLWTVTGFHAAAYMRNDGRRDWFHGFMIAAGTGNIGLVLARDALSFYLFFALMTFAAYALVVHTRTTEALRAGRVYLIMAVVGEALILAGLFQVMAFANDASFVAVVDAYAEMPAPGVTAALLIAGFGIKAGLMPLHLWLPLAHPVAPTPASALLSGAMIKAGVLGWLRFLPVGGMAFDTLGSTVLVIGSLATLVAAVLGVVQRDVKTVLAYSSISQMGFIAAGMGAVLLFPSAAPLLVLAIAVYAIHHALAKAALFLGVSAVHGTRPVWLLVAAALPGLVLAGAPLTSGAMAKSALKSALGEVPPPGVVPVDLLLTLAAVGTTLLMARYLSLLALGSAHGSHTAHERPGAGVLAPWLVLVTASVAAGAWLPRTLAPLGELPLGTSPGYLAAALWPVALGIVFAGSATILARRYPGLTTATVPAGDIVALLERSARRTRQFAAPLAERNPGPAVRRLWDDVGRLAEGAVDSLAAAYERLATGPFLGAIFVVVAVLLFAALL